MGIKKASIINAISKYSTVILNLVVTAILARLLSADDFGVVAIINVFIAFFQLFADMGFGNAVIHNQDLSEKDIEHIFSLTCYMALGLGIIFSIFSIPLSKIYDNSVYIALGNALSISLFFTSLNMIPNALLYKEKQFLKVAVRNIVVFVFSYGVAIISAYCGAKYYALVLQADIAAILTFVWNYHSTKTKFVFRIEWNRIKKVLGFSVYQFLFEILVFFSRNLDSLLIGRKMNEVELGYYDKSYKLARYPVQNLTNVITPVLLPILSEHQNDKEYIYSQYIKIVRLLSFVGIYFTIICFCCSSEVIIFLFGEQWRASIPSFHLLSLTIWSQMLSSSTGAIYQSLGKTKLMFISGVITAFINVVAIILGVMKGDINFVAFAITIAFTVNFFITYYILIKVCFQKGLLGFANNLKWDIVSFLVVVFVGSIINKYFIIDSVFISLLIKCVILTALFAIIACFSGQLKFILGFVIRKRIKND